jgi:hypothetical protein
VEAQLKRLRAFDNVRVVEAIREQLLHEPLTRTRHRKPLQSIPEELAEVARSLLGEVDAVWEFRPVPWRVAYVVEPRIVYVLWIFRKDRQTTDEALS